MAEVGGEWVLQRFALYFAKYLLCLALQISGTERKEDLRTTRSLGTDIRVKARTCGAGNVAMRILLRDLISASRLQGAEGCAAFKGVLRRSRGFGTLSGLCGQAAC